MVPTKSAIVTFRSQREYDFYHNYFVNHPETISKFQELFVDTNKTTYEKNYDPLSSPLQFTRDFVDEASAQAYLDFVAENAAKIGARVGSAVIVDYTPPN